MKDTIKNFLFLDKIQGLQLKISKCFESKNIIYCNNIFVQLPTIQFKIVELNIVSGIKREDTITITSKEKLEHLEHSILQIESTRKLEQKELGKIIKLFTKSTHLPRLIYTENEATAQAKEFENDMEFLEDIVKEEREIKINNPLINNNNE